MESCVNTREFLWAKQKISASEIDYKIWEHDKILLNQMSKINLNCTFVVDVYKCKYIFASENFATIFGYDSQKIASIEKQGDYLESRIHPDDQIQLNKFQVQLGNFIYQLPIEQRNDFCNIFSFRIKSIKQQYIRVISKHQVLEKDKNGKAWLILGNLDIAADQNKSTQVTCTVMNMKNKEIFSPVLSTPIKTNLTQRELEILRYIKNGFLSKQIADSLNISIHTVNIHRQNLLHKLCVQNSVEAINLATKLKILL